MNRFSVGAVGLWVLAVVVVAQFGGMVCADDLLPPDWRGTPLGAVGHFTNIQVQQEPSLSYDVTTQFYNRPNPNLNESVSFELPQIYLQTGAANFYTLFFPNWIDQVPLKIGRMQIYWLPPVGTEPNTSGPEILEILGIEGDNDVYGSVTGGGAIDIPPGTDNLLGWYVDFEIRPNPDYERIYFSLPAGSQLQQLDIDTESIPEPASVALLGGLALLALRRRIVG
jgi:hypothetical protein